MCLSVAALVYSLEACRWGGTLQLHGFFSQATYLLLFLPGCGNVHSGQMPKLIHKYVTCYTLRLSCAVNIVLLLKPRQRGSVLRNELAERITRGRRSQESTAVLFTLHCDWFLRFCAWCRHSFPCRFYCMNFCRLPARQHSDGHASLNSVDFLMFWTKVLC